VPVKRPEQLDASTEAAAPEVERVEHLAKGAAKEHPAASTTVSPESKATAAERTLNDKRVQKHKVIEDGFRLACSLEGENRLKEAEAQYRRTLAICTTLLGERPPTAHKSMRELRSRTSAALERVRTK